MTVSDWIALGAALAAVVALIISLAAYRQTDRLHAKPDLYIDWAPKIGFTGNVPTREIEIRNRGNAPARDLAVALPQSIISGDDWWTRDPELSPAGVTRIYVPVVAGVTVTTNQLGFIEMQHAGDGWLPIRPEVLLTWRQDGKTKRKTFRGPSTPSEIDTQKK